MSVQSEKRSSNFMYLMVEFPRVKSNDKEYGIVYYEKVFYISISTGAAFYLVIYIKQKTCSREALKAD